MGLFKNEKKEIDSDDEEEEEPNTKCLFQVEWDGEDKCWFCGLTDESVICNKSICPFWK